MSKVKWVSHILFFGALWGFLEATLGFFLQLPFVPFFVSGLVMFPIASALLVASYVRLPSQRAMFAIGLIAAAIKSLNLLSPMHYWRTVNPMVSIILETLVVVVVVQIVILKPWRQKLIAFTFASVGWRLLFMAYMGGQFITTGFVHVNLSSLPLFLEFTLLSGILGGFMASGLYYIYAKLTEVQSWRISIQPVTASLMVLIAILFTVIL